MVNANETPELVEWIRARLLEELPTCSPRQLASVLLDLAAWNGTLIDAKTLDRLQREIRRSIDGHSRGHAMRARDLASIISGYARLPSAVAGLEARQSAMAPLLPEMIRLMPGCSVQDLCELLHGLASTHITDRALLEAWSSNFVHKALERAEFDAAGSGETIRLDLNPIQMSLAVADLAKLRFIKQDPHMVFSKLLRSISDVSPSLGGLAVCHVVCALARASDARTLSWRSKKVLTVHTNEDSFQMLLLNKLEAQLLNRMDELQPQGLSASAAAFVKLRRCSQELFAGLARVSMRCLASFSPEDFAMMSSALGAVPDAFSSSWSCSLLEQLGEHAARSLTQSSWSPRQVAQVFRPFASQALPEGLLTAAVGHFRTEAKNYSPRDVAKFLSGIGSATRNKDFAAVLWGALKPRLAARNPASGAETLAMAQALAQLRHVIPASQLRHRFRFLSRSLRRAVDCQLLQPHEQATALQIWALLGLRDWPLLAKLAGRGLEALAANTVLRLTDGADTILPAHPEDLSEAIYAFAKLGAPDLVPGACRPPVSGFLLRAMKVLDAADAVVRLSERGLQQLLLGIALSGPSEEVFDLQRRLLQKGLEAWFPLDAASETARLVTNCAALEFWFLVAMS
ncbi:Uncharacterized protein SCF082_LOCUS4926 [Durusdinium trenchii]|uniref:Uncharacterized protein n=1 Tax=Durusdinium trenchii TaxID=1381693 RepID=A0ABP0I2F0_9DINO